MAALYSELCNYPVSDPVLASLLDACRFCVGTLHPVPAPEPESSAHPNAPPPALVCLLELARNVFGLVTCAHALPTPSADAGGRRVGAVFSFRGFGRVALQPADVACVTRDAALDAAVVELSEHCVAQLRQRGARFLHVATARLGDQVAAVHYERNDELALFKGLVHEISSDSATIHYNDGGVHVAAAATSGSPLLLWNAEAVGLNCERKSDQSPAATRLLDIVASHLIARTSIAAPTATTRATRPTSSAKPIEASISGTSSDKNPLAELAFAFPGEAVFNTDEALFVTGMSTDPAADVVFLSYTVKTHTHESTRWRSGVREVSLATRSITDAYTARELNAFVYGVGFVAATHTLLVCTNENDLLVNEKVGRCLEGLARRDGDADGDWVLQHRVPFESGLGPVRFAELSDAQVLYGERYWSSRLLHLLRVSSDHHIESLARVDVPEGFHTFDARVVAGDSLVAFVAKDKSRVRLSRLLPSHSLQELSSIELPRTQKLLWSGDLLLAGYWNKEHKAYSIVEVQRAGDKITATRVLLDEKNSFEWDFAGGRTAIFDIHTKELFVHSAEAAEATH